MVVELYIRSAVLAETF